jgi:recombination protein RecT
MSISSALSTITSDIYGMRGSFESVAIDRNVNFEREAGFAIQVLGNNDYALKIALGNRQSVIDAVTNVAAIGISLNPAKKQAYLVPRGGKICLDISYMGLMDLAMETGSIKWAQATLVHEADMFALNGFDKPPLHQYSPFGARGPIIGVYVVVKTADGEYLTHTMDIASAYAIRDRSESWKKGQSGPWKSDEGEMIKKTCVKQAYKYWPKTERLETAIHHLDTEGGEGIVLEQSKTCPADLLAGWVAKAQAARTPDELTMVWKDGLAAIKPTGDMRAYDSLKLTVASRGETLKAMHPPERDITPVVPAEMESLIADLEASADGGSEAFIDAWNSLSKTTRAKIEALPGAYDRLKERANQVGGPE